MISALSKLSSRQPIQELAFHKEQWEINGVPFECHESYYEGELLNGIDLRVKAVRGLSNRESTFDYLQDSQELIFAAGAHLMVYSTHRRNYHQLFSLQGDVLLLRTHLEKMNNREYVLWAEAYPSPEDAQLAHPAQVALRPKAHSRIARRAASFNHRNPNSPKNNAPKSIFSLSPDLTGTLGMETGFGKVEEEGVLMLRVFDYTKKEFVFEGTLEMPAGHTLKEVFLFMNHYKMVGFVSEDYQSNTRHVHFQNLETQAKNTNDPFPHQAFTSLTTPKNVTRLLFNSELNHFLFAHANTLNALRIREDTPDADHELFKQFLSLSDGKPKERGKAVRLEVEECVSFEEEVLSVAVSDQYVAVLTPSRITFLSAFDPSTRIFDHLLDVSPRVPLGIEFNKSALMLTYRGVASIVSFGVKGKALRVVGESALGVGHCKEILRIFTNNISAEVFCVVRFYELQSRDRPSDFAPIALQTELLEGLVQYVSRPASVDVVAAFLGSSSEGTNLGVSRRRFRRVHGCAWLSGVVVETEEAVELGMWRESFESKKCVAVHPNGLFIVVCLKEAFRIYVITQEGFANSYRGDSLKDIQACAISTGGNHLAVASPNAIHVYDFYSCSRLRTITLPFGVVIQSLQFSGHTLVCQLRSKKVYLFDSLNEYRESLVFNAKAYLNDPTAAREQEAASALVAMAVSEVVTMVTFSPFYYCPLLNFFLYSYQATVYFFNCATNAVHTTVELAPLSCIHYSHNLATLFLGTTTGELVCFPWPNKPATLQCEQRRFKLHAGKIIDIRVSSDLREVVTVGDDETLCVSAVTAVRNLKRFEGLELVEHLSGSIRICYDFLSRRGLCLFTHGKMAEKNDQLKDCEDAVLNANFILPEERQKQKEQMFANVKLNMRDIAQGNQHQYDDIARSTNQARDDVARLRHQAADFARHSQLQREDMRQAMFNEYIAKYNASEASIKEQQATILRLAQDMAATRERLAAELQQAQEESRRNFAALESEQEAQVRAWRREEPAELQEIEEEKRAVLGANMGALEEVIAEIHNSNGVLACRNNNLEKQIAELKRKMEEHGYLLHRLRASTDKLAEDHARYDALKADNKRSVEREDRINLAEIERRYVKQTQTLIERDKEINVQLVNHEKEKNILIHLEKTLEGVEASIETLVTNILQEKKDRKEELLRIDAARAQARDTTADMMAAKKDKISSRNHLHNYLCKLEATLDELLHTRSKQQRLDLLRSRELIHAEPTPDPHAPQEKEILSKLLSEKVQTARVKSNKPSLLRSAANGSLRVLKTEASEGSGRGNSLRQGLATTCRQAVERRSKEVYMKLDAEQKQYERIKTEQLVFENTRKKFNLENQDLIENYNSLAMENKKFVSALRRQQSLSRVPIRRGPPAQGDAPPTPFQLYLRNKANAHSHRTFVPLGSYQTTE